MGFSVVIPTMWKSKKIIRSIEDFLICDFVSEIIIINNDSNNKPDFDFNHEKIKMLDQESNIYVNPSWNLGVKTSSKENILIMNDDVYIEDICELFKMVYSSDFDLIGLDKINSNVSNEFSVNKIEDSSKRLPYFGSCFFVKKDKYIHIPDDILIWCGDGIQYSFIKNRGLFTAPKIDLEMSVTLKHIPNLNHILYGIDRPKYLDFCKLHGVTPL